MSVTQPDDASASRTGVSEALDIQVHRSVLSVAAVSDPSVLLTSLRLP